MNQTVRINNEVTEDGAPHGGTATAEGMEITWQPPTSSDLTGALVESVITAALVRLEFLQLNSSPTRERSLAITKLEEALHWLSHKSTT